MANENKQFRTIARPDAVLAELLQCHRPDGTRSPCRATYHRGISSVSYGDIKYEIANLIEIQLMAKKSFHDEYDQEITSSDADDFSAQDAGAIVTSRQGDVVGVIVAASGDTARIAPLYRLFRDRGLTPATMKNTSRFLISSEDGMPTGKPAPLLDVNSVSMLADDLLFYEPLSIKLDDEDDEAA